MARPLDRKLTFKEHLCYRKYRIKQYYKEAKKICREDLKENWESYLIIAGGTFLGVFIFYVIVLV